jgi:hypothetical protein
MKQALRNRVTREARGGILLACRGFRPPLRILTRSVWIARRGRGIGFIETRVLKWSHHFVRRLAGLLEHALAVLHEHLAENTPVLPDHAAGQLCGMRGVNCEHWS